MQGRWIGVALIAGLAIGTAGSLSAQQRAIAPGQPSIVNEDADVPPPAPSPQTAKPKHASTPKTKPAFEHDPDIDAADQFAPSQVMQAMPEAVPQPTRSSRKSAARTATQTPDAVPEPAASGRPRRAAAPPIVTCGGVFAKDSSHEKLAMAFATRNVSYTQVDAGTVGKVMASVVYAKDPKRRLEVWWSKPGTRSDTRFVVINGRSGWAAPGGVHLGLTLAELEGLNGKPFKLLGFNRDNVAVLSDWNGGALAALPGGCKVGVSLRPDPKTPPGAVAALSADQVYTSADAALRTVNPKVSEILVAY